MTQFTVIVQTISPTIIFVEILHSTSSQRLKSVIEYSGTSIIIRSKRLLRVKSQPFYSHKSREAADIYTICLDCLFPFYNISVCITIIYIPERKQKLLWCISSLLISSDFVGCCSLVSQWKKKKKNCKQVERRCYFYFFWCIPKVSVFTLVETYTYKQVAHYTLSKLKVQPLYNSIIKYSVLVLRTFEILYQVRVYAK